MAADLVELVGRLGTPRVLVVGDVMLDRYVWGDAARVSQEAPVLLLRADRREERLGGASSVATMLRALGAEVALAGVVGSDATGDRIHKLLSQLGVDHSGVITDASRPSTLKERYIGRAQQRHPQQILRVDYETCEVISQPLEDELIDRIASNISTCEAILTSDYDKGVCTPSVMAETIRLGNAAGIPVLADPIRGGDYTKYRGFGCLTPNRLEASQAIGMNIKSQTSALIAAERLLHQLDLQAAVVTLDKDGMAFADRTGRRALFPTRPRQVYDITGAGDMVLSVLGLALAAGADYPDAIRLANVAGGLEVEKIGVVPVTRDEIIADLNSHDSHGHGHADKIVSAEDLVREVHRRRQSGQRVAFTNGCFDVFHAGHVQYLNEARGQADLLIVAVNSDASVRNLKGVGRPINPFSARASVLAGLTSVDYVSVFDAPTPLLLIEQIKPDVLVKGADYRKDEVIGAELVESYGGRVHLAKIRPGYSTTNVLQRLQAA
jgi:D-beta-D-heptose 7-phosphate kinase/D-beta-D-heptose 1-phosphate adenosyltransferase